MRNGVNHVFHKAVLMTNLPLLMIVTGRLDLLRVLDLAGELGGRVDQGGEALRAKLHFFALILQGNQRYFVFRFLAIEAGFHF
jgi:hypothetical protein